MGLILFFQQYLLKKTYLWCTPNLTSGVTPARVNAQTWEEETVIPGKKSLMQKLIILRATAVP